MSRYELKLPPNWEIGDLLLGPNAYVKLPITKNQPKVTLREGWRKEPECFRSREFTGVDPERHERHARQHRQGEGWRSTFHPKVLDYRTVDELGLHYETLEEERVPRTQAAKQLAEQVVDNLVVEGDELLRESEGNPFNPSVLLQHDTPVFGEIKPVNRKPESNYLFYRVDVPKRSIPVGLQISVTALHGDPDVYVCNRNRFPMQQAHEHTWKSQHAGDDVIFIPPHDELFKASVPGMCMACSNMHPMHAYTSSSRRTTSSSRRRCPVRGCMHGVSARA